MVRVRWALGSCLWEVLSSHLQNAGRKSRKINVKNSGRRTLWSRKAKSIRSELAIADNDTTMSVKRLSSCGDHHVFLLGCYEQSISHMLPKVTRSCLDSLCRIIYSIFRSTTNPNSHSKLTPTLRQTPPTSPKKKKKRCINRRPSTIIRNPWIQTNK